MAVRTMYSFARTAGTKYHEQMASKKKCMASQFWGLELQDQSVDRVDSFSGPGGKALFQAPWLGHGHLLPISPHPLLSVHVCLSVEIFPFYKDTSHSGLGPTLMTSS